ncbi:flagellar hook-basal body complex protein FliE [Roseovarius amoyensis]|uniref:flagellar hook-basal body complex protein FliE n=1 Tax=Roseovarius amoyensis TaxID=2211448 RepID=UPI000DBE1578|nr:flagellar hook-basal body complex protein FliE [Roseovarius amoyensis]
MDIGTIGAAQRYTAARPATEPENTTPGPDEAAKDAALDFAATLERGEALARAAMTGEADPHALVQALAQSELAVETVVTVRDKVVEAYQEILRMPV